jgi:hypothetical protein
MFINSSGHYDGYCVEIIDIIAKRLNFSYIIKTPKDKRSGILNNGTWNGMMKMFLDGVRKYYFFINLTNYYFSISEKKSENFIPSLIV